MNLKPTSQSLANHTGRCKGLKKLQGRCAIDVLKGVDLMYKPKFTMQEMSVTSCTLYLQAFLLNYMFFGG